MAVYATFFLSEAEKLAAGFPNWKLPLPQPVRRETRNPFTGEPTVVESREPDWPEYEQDFAPEFDAIAIEGNYGDYLESRLPAFVRSCTHWAAKGITEVELEALLRAGGMDGTIEHAIYAPPSSGAMVQILPSTFSAMLRSADLPSLAKQWAAQMSRPEHTQSVDGHKLNDGWSARDAMSILKNLSVLAGQQRGTQRMYLLTEV